jgi:hypothetical protein
MDGETAQVPEEFRPACGRPESRVIVRHFPVTIPHALCDLTGVAISYPGHGGATVHATPSLGPLDFTGTLREGLEVLTAGLLARKR